MSEHDWLMLLIGINVGGLLLIFIVISALVSGFIHGYLKGMRGDE